MEALATPVFILYLIFVSPPCFAPTGNCCQEMEFLDITSIRDTRFGKFAKIPKVSGPRSSYQLHRAKNKSLLGEGRPSVGPGDWVLGCWAARILAQAKEERCGVVAAAQLAWGLSMRSGHGGDGRNGGGAHPCP